MAEPTIARHGAPECSKHLPREPGAAFLLATVYRRLGGSFSIGSKGKRYFGRPEPALFRLQGKGLPQLPDAEPHEQFHENAEWRGAIKLVEALLSRLDNADSDMIFAHFASIAVDERKFIPSIEEPRRTVGQQQSPADDEERDGK